MVYDKSQVNKILDKIKDLEEAYALLMFEDVKELEPVRYDTMEHYRAVPDDVDWVSLKKGDSWGGPFANMWIKDNFTVPQEFEGRKLVICSNTGSFESFVYIDGEPKGLFNADADHLTANHSIALLTQDAKSGLTYDIALECYAGTPWIGCMPYENYGRDRQDDSEFVRNYQFLKICAVRQDVAKFLFDLRTVNQMARCLDETSFRRGEIVSAIVDVFKTIHQYPYDVEESVWRSTISGAQKVLDKVLAVKNGPSMGSVGLIGHSHMDTAWLWTVKETIRKCARTYSNALSLMDWYPEYTFIQSSVLHIDWMKEYYPSIFNRMKERIEEGRYEPNGAVWVECDCNITGGESMVRQFLTGQRYTMENFNYKADSFWLPDTFGYNAALPQIMQESGVKYFLTTKMGWNETNVFPHESFTWKGIDGSDVLVHFNRTHVWPDPETITSNTKDLPNKHVTEDKLVSYGFGDGGGGPQYQMVEMSKRIEDTNGITPSKHTTVSKFMNKLEESSAELPVWNGELYLELHRGTLTMMHDIKRSNRLAEFALRELEALTVMTDICNKNIDIADKLDAWWKVILCNQFHDILPGTCIPEVYDLAIPQNYKVVDEVKSESVEVLKGVADKTTDKVTIFNSLSWDRQGQVELTGVEAGKAIADASSQTITKTDGQTVSFAKVNIPQMSAKSFDLVPVKADKNSSFKYNNDLLETPFALIKFAKDGSIESLVDKKTNREIRNQEGLPLNTLLVGQDVPHIWDNWDIDSDIDMKLSPDMRLLSREVVADGELQFRIESKYDIGLNSTLKQQIIFYSDNPRIDFETIVDWHEKHTLLKVDFNVDVLATTMKNEIQFGHIDRPTYRNTSWDAARFEVCNHKWTDLSENRFGVAILNDCKYGISCLDSDMQLTLHKAGTRPDPRGDEGVHEFTYSLLTHDGAFSTENVVRPSYELNVKPVVCVGQADIDSMFTVNSPNVIVESVKPAVDGQGYIIRMYECERSATNNTVVTFSADIKKAYWTNMLEEVKEELSVDNNKIKLEFKPFEIKTLLIK